MPKINLKKFYRNALVYTTKACNLRCPRCFMDDCSKEILSYSMTKQQFRNIIDRLREQKIKVNWMCLSGGEPTLWPHLCWAIDYAKTNATVKHILVGTNAIGRSVEDYGDADVVCMTHYGAINRYDILKLRQQLGRRRARIQYVVHLPLPLPENKGKSLPADCGCINMAFVGDRVYPCGMSAAREVGDFININEDFQKIFLRNDPRFQELCKTCLSNRKNKYPYGTNLTFEFGIWDSAICFMHSFGWKAKPLRRLYRYYHKSVTKRAF